MAELSPEWLCTQILEGTPDAVIFADLEGVIRLWNAGAETLFGYPAAEATGQSLEIIIPERLRARHWEGYTRAMQTGVTRYGNGELLAVPGVRKDGSRVSLEFSVTLVHDAGGTLAGIAAVMRDVTARWERDRALRQQLAGLEQQVRELGASTQSP